VDPDKSGVERRSEKVEESRTSQVENLEIHEVPAKTCLEKRVWISKPLC